MPQETMRSDIEKLREATLRNNIVWLKSFGCTVIVNGGFIRVSQSQMPDFTAWIITDSKPDTARALARSLSAATSADGLSIYVDDLVDIAELPGLGTARLLPDVSWIHTVTVRHHERQPSCPVAAREVGPEKLSLWADLYGEGFDRNSEQRKLDALRWARSVANPHLKHWLFVEDGRDIGVAQTCHAFGVTGVYSFTLRPQYTRSNLARFAMRAIADNILGNDRMATLYFERVSLADSCSRRRQFHSTRIIRSYIHYELNPSRPE
ncbi:hypothetical protein CBA19CS22_18005 [Caballeronia novacaledonica]|uniref:Uncharacterized protein n=1 Tax=Caballeronia novacaledonica TaxID=1544861 RepID=A0ACB5QV09_9BURK|nr:hypothetical protein CBA19CS22_18005 [Caballeronia novacaledonica]